DVAARSLGEEPAVLENLVEDLRRRPLRPQLGRHGGDRRLEDLAQPASGGGRVGDGSLTRALEVCLVPRQIVEQPSRLVLLRVEAGQVEEPPPVVPRLDDLRVKSQPDFAAVADELDLLDVEAELVEATQPLLQALPLSGGEDLVRRQL